MPILSGSKKSLFVILWAVVLIGGFQLPFNRFMADDLIQLGVLEGRSPLTWVTPLELYSFLDGDPGHLQKYLLKQL